MVAVVVATFGPAVGAGCAALQPAPEAPRVTEAVQLDVLAGPQVGQPVQDGVIGLVGPELTQVDQRAFGEQVPVLRLRPSGRAGPVATRQLGQRAGFVAQVLFEPGDEPAGHRGQLVRFAEAPGRGRHGEIVDVITQPEVVLAEPVDTRGGGSAQQGEGLAVLLCDACQDDLAEVAQQGVELLDGRAVGGERIEKSSARAVACQSRRASSSEPVLSAVPVLGWVTVKSSAA
jgi:hypothetical protein